VSKENFPVVLRDTLNYFGGLLTTKFLEQTLLQNQLLVPPPKLKPVPQSHKSLDAASGGSGACSYIPTPASMSRAAR
jgi:hypothetical protein